MAGKKAMEALKLRKMGFNCAQAVALPFCEELGMPSSAAAKALEGFGGGMGGYELVCGALSGAIFVAGLVLSDGNLEHPNSKRQTYAICTQINDAFKKECGSHFCPQIKGRDTGVPLKTCEQCVLAAVSIAERVLADAKDKK